MEDQQQTRRNALAIERLHARYTAAFEAWVELYDDTGWWVSPRKRRLMLFARLAHQAAKLDYMCSQMSPSGASATD